MGQWPLGCSVRWHAMLCCPLKSDGMHVVNKYVAIGQQKCVLLWGLGPALLCESQGLACCCFVRRCASVRAPTVCQREPLFATSAVCHMVRRGGRIGTHLVSGSTAHRVAAAARDT